MPCLAIGLNVLLIFKQLLIETRHTEENFYICILCCIAILMGVNRFLTLVDTFSEGCDYRIIITTPEPPLILNHVVVFIIFSSTRVSKLNSTPLYQSYLFLLMNIVNLLY